MMGSRFPILRALALAAGLLILAASFAGCRSLIEAVGYTVVDEDLVQISKARNDATQEYVDATLPILDKGFDGLDLVRMQDLGKTLKRVSAKEHNLLSNDVEEDGKNE